MAEGRPAGRLPPLERWWPTYVLVGAGAIVAAIAALRSVAELLAPVRHALLLILFGLVLAFVLAPLANTLERYLRVRALAVVISFLIAVVVVVGAISLVATPLVREGRNLVDQLPRLMQTVQGNEPVSIAGIEIPREVRQDLGRELGQRAGAFADQALAVVVRIVSGVIDIVLVLVLGLYFLASAPRIRRGILAIVPAEHRERVDAAEGEIVRVLGAYVRGQLLLALIIGVVSTVIFSLLGLRYALFLGVFAGVMELVPIIGPIVAGTAAAVIALFQPFPLVVWVIVAAIAIQQLENHILVPRISGGAVGIHPLAALLAVLVGIEAFGVAGGLFAVPVAGLIWVFVGSALAAWRERQAAVSAEGQPTSA
jgi:predicted PurR-regulated permease PerM